MKEYNDCQERAQRLSIARESYLSKSTAAINAVNMEDVLIYLRWFVCHLHASKKCSQFLKVSSTSLSLPNLEAHLFV